MSTKATLIFDNGGGLTMQLRATFGGDGTAAEFAHHYNDMEHAVTDLRAFFSDPNGLHDWDGHDDACMALVATDDEIRNGGYTVCEYDSWDEVLEDQGYAGGSGVIIDFETAVAANA